MIPPDVASALRAHIPDSSSAPQSQQTQPVLPAQRIADVLGNLVPGQRIFAEVQGMLANGTYRATVAQRDITLALPFSAKAGDSLELEVTESDGKLTLALIANRGEAEVKPGQQSVSTSLSTTGKLIGDLMQGIDGEGKRAPAAPLNGNQALVSSMPKDAALLAPVLKQALTQSGMFYEAHQARWVAGQLPTEQLRQEPQGKLLAPAPNIQTGSPSNQKTQETKPPQTGALPTQNTTQGISAMELTETSPPTPAQVSTRAEAPLLLTGTGIPRDIAPLVQQQLDGLANQNFAWQGQIWPGQKMWWEIGENPEDRNLVGDEASARWHTRLKLTLPQLGGVDARLHLQPGGELGIRILSNSSEGEERMRNGMAELHKQMEAAGLNIRQILIDHESEPES
jgi:hypothetical protein